VGSAALVASCLVLLGCVARASPDIELLMQAAFARDLGWSNASALCNSSADAYNITCDSHENVIYM
jgi:hypothetical protein